MTRAATRAVAPGARATTRGVALVNALLVVAALSAAAAALLLRAEGSRARHAMIQATAQADLYLDAIETLIAQLLAEDAAQGDLDHLGELWATEGYAAPIGRGNVTGVLEDLQGRLNVNAEAPAMAAALDRLARAEGARPLAGAIEPRVPVPLPERLGLAPEARAALLPHLAALDAEAGLNVNTAGAAALAAGLSLSPGAARTIVEMRADQPFESPAAFAARAAHLLPQAEAVPIAVGSAWFEARLTASLDGHSAARRVVFSRSADGTVAVTLRLRTAP